MKARIEEIARRVIAEKGMDLVELIIRPAPRKSRAIIYVDKPGGVTVRNCAEIARELNVLFMVEDNIPDDLILEVSSPGVDRPLKTIRDFERNLERMLEVVYTTEDDRTAVAVGKLIKVNEESVELLDEDNETRVIPRPFIRKAVQHIKF